MDYQAERDNIKMWYSHLNKVEETETSLIMRDVYSDLYANHEIKISILENETKELRLDCKGFPFCTISTSGENHSVEKMGVYFFLNNRFWRLQAHFYLLNKGKVMIEGEMKMSMGRTTINTEFMELPEEKKENVRRIATIFTDCVLAHLEKTNQYRLKVITGDIQIVQERVLGL